MAVNDKKKKVSPPVKKTKKSEKALQIYVGDQLQPLAIQDIVTEKQINLLASPTPDKFIKQREGRGGRTFDYVEGHYVVAVLNAVFGFNWDDTVVEKIVNESAKQIAMLVRLTVRFANGQAVTKEGWGGSDIKYTKGDIPKIIDLADDLKSAHTDALKKAASYLGVAWDVYSGQTGLVASSSGDTSGKSDSRAGEDKGVEPPAESGIEDMATNPEEEIDEAKKLGDEIKSALTAKTLDPKDFKLWLSTIQNDMGKKFVGLHFGNPSFREGEIKDLKFLNKWLNDRVVNEEVKKGFVPMYLEYKMSEEKTEEVKEEENEGDEPF